MSSGIETLYIAVRRLSERLGWEISHYYKTAPTPAGAWVSRYSACTLPEEMQRRMAVLDMVEPMDVVPGVGSRWQGLGAGNWFYELDPWCPFEDLVATGLFTHIKDKPTKTW